MDVNIDPKFEGEVRKIAGQILSQHKNRDRMPEPFETLTVVIGEENLGGAAALHRFEFEEFPSHVFVIENQED